MSRVQVVLFLIQVLHLDLGVAAYTPLKGASYLPLPKKLKDKKAVLNIQNEDEKCFLWSILAAKYPVDRTAHANRTSNYTRYEPELNMVGIEDRANQEVRKPKPHDQYQRVWL